jgi:hypothetical protein
VREGEARELGAQGRRGILTLGATMLVHARSNDSSPIHRGRLIRERLLCEELPPPPAGIVIEPPALDSQKTSRERYAAHSEQELCAGCHRLMDPIGFAFEHFDGIGRYRPDDHGQAIDQSAQILGNSDVKGDFPNLEAMIDELAQSEQVRGCYASSLVRFAHGFGDDERGECLARRGAQAFASTDGTLTSLIRILTQPELLLMRERGSSDQAGEREGDPDAMVDNEQEPAGSEDAGEAPAEESYELKQTVNNDWGAGYCHTYEVINRSDAPLAWAVSRDLGGTLNQNWESKASGSTGTVQFTGAVHNAVLAPGASTQFGFCVTR